MKKTLDNLKSMSEETNGGDEDLGKGDVINRERKVRQSKLTASEVDADTRTSVICNHVRHSGVRQKFRICESDRATRFLNATMHFQHEVFTRVCDLQDPAAVFSATGLFWNGDRQRTQSTVIIPNSLLQCLQRSEEN